jgi:WD40 repeat protein
MAQIFISHSNRDNDLASEITSALRQRGFDDVFLDIDKHAGIPPGADWERRLYRMIDSAHAVILVLTPNWYESKWCFFEFGQARALGKAIFPVIVAPTGDRYIAPDIQHLDLQLDREGGLERLARELTRLALDVQGGFKWDSNRAPYPGLLAFEKEDAAVFFGRDDDTRRVIERLNSRRVQGGAKLVLLLGASGSGKSSLMRAGVLPRLERDNRNWIIVPPFRPRSDFAGEFAKAACGLIGDVEEVPLWRKRFLSEDAGKHLEDFAAKARARANAREAHLLVTIDQGEELFAASDQAQPADFLQLLAAVSVEAVPIIVFLGLRSDYLDRFQRSCPARFDDISLGPFPLARVRQIIEGPARVAGLHIQEGLVSAAIIDMAVQDALPLLAFRLRDLYDRFISRRPTEDHDRYAFTLDDYLSLGDPAAGLNPLENAVRERADTVLKDLALSEASLRRLREAFVGGLVRLDERGQYVRRPALWDQLPKEAHPALERLAQARLLVIRAEQQSAIVEVAHEALLRKWPRLRGWLDEERDFLAGKEQLRYAVKTWNDAHSVEKDTALLHGLALSRARPWLEDHSYALTTEEKQYIELSISQDDQAIRRQRWRRRFAWGSAAVVTFLILVALFLDQQTRAAATRADAAALAIQARLSVAADPIRAAGLAAKAVTKNSSVDTNSILVESVLALSPHLVDVLAAPDLNPTSLGWTDAGTIAIGGWGKILEWQPAASDWKQGVATALFDAKARAPRDQKSALAVARVGARTIAVTEDGRRLIIDTSGAISSESLLQGDLLKANISDGGSAILVARLDEPEVVLFRCKNPSLEHGNCVRTAVASDFASAIAFDPQHAVAAIGLDDGTVKLIGLGNQPFNEQVSLRDPVAALAWAPDGSRLAVGTVNGRTVVTDSHGAHSTEGSIVRGSVSALAWNRDASLLAGTCDTNSICLWRWSESEAVRLIQRAEGHTEPITALAWRSDTRELASSADHSVRLWSFDPQEPVSVTLGALPSGALTDLSASNDHQWLAAGDEQGKVHVWGIESLTAQVVPPNETVAEIRVVAWSPRAPVFATLGADGRVTVQNWPNDARPVILPDVGDDLYTLAWLPDGKSVVTAGTNDGAIKIRPIDGSRPEVLAPGHQDSVLAFAVTKDGSKLFSVDAKGSLRRWDLATRKPLDSSAIETGISRNTLVLSRDESRVLVAGNDGDVLIYRTDQSADGKSPIRCHSGSRDLDGAAFGPDDKTIFALSGDAVLHMWSLSETCDIAFSAPFPLRKGSIYRRRHLISLPERSAMAVTISTNEIWLVSTDLKKWLKRAQLVARFER